MNDRNILTRVGGSHLIEAHNVSKHYGKRAVLKELSMKVDDGEIVALLGPNGAGKTTLLRIMSTLTRPSGGDVLIDGSSIFEDPTIARRLIGVVGHSSYIYDDLTPYENLKFYWLMNSLPYENFSSRANALLEELALAHRKNDRTEILSKGMRQRLAIARALIPSPKILLLDEPFSSLDQKGIDILIKMLSQERNEGKSIVMVTHDSYLLSKLADRADVLIDGRIIRTFTADELKRDTFGARYKEFMMERMS